MRITSLEYARLTLRDDNILHIEYADNYNFTIIESQKIFVAARALCSDLEKCPVYISGGLKTTSDNAFRNHNASQEVMQHCSAVAFQVNSLAQVIIVNFFIKFHKPLSPVRFFKSQEKALEWLKKFETVKSKVPVKEKSTPVF